MFQPSNRIIIVDNQKSELETLGKSFLENGLGCRTFLYDQEYTPPLQNIRIAFFDINLTSKTVDHSYTSSEDLIKFNSPIFNDLATAINLYIAKDNGPYVLIFWTANKDIVPAFIEYMQETKRGFSETASPVFISYIDKPAFLFKPDSTELSNKVIEQLNNEKIKFLFDFEDKVNSAGEKTINKIYDIIPKEKKWGENTVLFENLGKILSKIAASTLGFSHSKQNPGKAIFEGLLPLLNAEISNATNNTNWKTILEPLFSASAPHKLTSPDDLIQRKVNAVFHIDKPNGHKITRGSVIEINKHITSIHRLFGIDSIDDWFDKLIPFKQGKEKEKEHTRSHSMLIAIELSAACDYSNDKHRINKYILGFKTPVIDVKNNIDKNSRIESSYHVAGANFHYEKQDFQIWLNLNFVFGTRPIDPRLGNQVFILKKEIMDMIGNKYAGHVSRIGITSF